ncbi:MAG: helix-turn-helix transcriptional regulator [Hyphomicrobiales bacterium]|nr:helix-turn-helix transcriptional regulator [Hyphomicrobiales bacterium]
MQDTFKDSEYKDSEYLSRLISRIYDASLDRKLWKGVVEECCLFIGGPAGNLFFCKDSAQNPEAFFAWGTDNAFQSLYNQKYTKMNPIFPVTTFYAAGTVVSQSDILPHADMRQTRFHQEWLQPQGITDALFGIIQKSPTGSSLLAVRRYDGDPPVDARMRRRMALVLPHLQRAGRIGAARQFQDTKNAALTDTLAGLATAVFLVRADAKIVFANAAAQTMLSEMRVVRGYHSLLTAVCPDANVVLRHTFAAAALGDGAASGAIAAPIVTKDGERWIAHVLPLQSGARRDGADVYAVAAVFVRKVAVDTPRALEGMSKLYRLTAGELRVLQALGEGCSVAAAADMLGVTESTVKTHLRHLFEKTGVNRQADLIKLLAGADSPIAKPTRPQPREA